MECLKLALAPAFGIADGISGALGVLAGFLVSVRPQWQALTSELLWLLPLSAFFGVALVRFLLAPYRLHERAETEVMRLREKLRTREEFQAKADMLALLVVGATEIQARPINDVVEMNRRAAEYADWYALAMRQIGEALPAAELLQFRTVAPESGDIPGHPLDTRERHLRTVLAGRIGKLRTMTGRYQNYAATGNG